jgi:hypothetical protein
VPTALEQQEIESALRTWGRYWVGNEMLDAVGVENAAGARDARFRARLQTASDAQLAPLREFFDLRSERHRHWGLDFKLFVSHVAAAVGDLLPLAQQLKNYGIEPFLAHEHIAPGLRWHEELTHALGTMDALLSFHGVGFNQSPWCNQEVGFALGRGVTIIPVAAGEVPSGFMGEIQAIRWRPAQLQDVTDAVLARIRENHAARHALGEALSRRLKFSTSFAQTDFLIAQLQQLGVLSAAAQHQVSLGIRFNNQVGVGEAVLALAGETAPP